MYTLLVSTESVGTVKTVPSERNAECCMLHRLPEPVAVATGSASNCTNYVTYQLLQSKSPIWGIIFYGRHFKTDSRPFAFWGNLFVSETAVKLIVCGGSTFCACRVFCADFYEIRVKYYQLILPEGFILFVIQFPLPNHSCSFPVFSFCICWLYNMLNSIYINTFIYSTKHFHSLIATTFIRCNGKRWYKKIHYFGKRKILFFQVCNKSCFPVRFLSVF